MRSATSRLQQYLQHRRRFEWAFWMVSACIQATANTMTGWIDGLRHGAHYACWEVASWEFSSNLALLCLIPMVIRALDAWPMIWGCLRHNLPRHFVASLVFSVAHVVLMVALRKLAYALHGQTYDFGYWPVEMGYEALKDIRTYALIAAMILLYRLILWRLQGEATILQPPDEPVPAPVNPPASTAASTDVPAAPERFLVKKLGKEFLLPTGEIEWVQACGNYVNLHRLGHDYPLRSTLSTMQDRLGKIFFRVHRSYLVQLDHVAAIEPNESGDALLRLRSGASIPCSRSHLEALRQVLASTP